MTSVSIRGIYTTALTQRLLEGDYEVVDASDPIQRRFHESFGEGPPDAAITTTHDRQGVGISGDPEAVAEMRDALADVAIDALDWPDPAPAGAVANAEVVDTRGGGAVLDLPGGATGYLPFDDADGYVDVGDTLRVQVRDPTPPWDDYDARVGTEIEAADAGGLLRLTRGEEGVQAAGRGAGATELARSTELLDVGVPEGWGLRWRRAATDADLEARGAALERAAAVAAEIDEGVAEAPPPAESAPGPVATPAATAWIWFGRESRFALDDDRRAVTATIPGHHRIKAADEAASAGVDLAEALVGEDSAAGVNDGEADFPFEAVRRQFGPAVGDDLALRHGKPDGRQYDLGSGDVTAVQPDGKLTLRREITSRGEYDALGTEREPGDAAISTLKEGRWWYPTAYRGEDGERKGKYVNVCTPVELFPDAATYVDLHVDVIDPPEDPVEIVDEDELEAAVAAGHLSEELADRARSVAERVRTALTS